VADKHDKPLRLAGYARVSTDDQRVNGVSLQAQRQAMASYTLAYGYRLHAVYEDAGVSGTVPPSKRRGLSRALAVIKEGKADGLLVYKLDRLSRSVRDVLDLADSARREGWDLASVQERLDTSTATGKFALGLLALLAELERDQVGERTRMALAEVARQGRHRGRFAAFGWHLEDGSVTCKRGTKGKLVECSEEQALLRYMLSCRKTQQGVRATATAMNRRKRWNPRTGRPWTPGNVAAILRTWDRRKAIGGG
jgi:site-specific DNA recombinase